MDHGKKILNVAKKQGRVTSIDIARALGVSRQYAHRLIHGLFAEGKLLRIGSTRGTVYIVPEVIPNMGNTVSLTLQNVRLQEHKVLQTVEQKFPQLRFLKENIQSIFAYAFSEMLNNAIEHSRSKRITIHATIDKNVLTFVIRDWGLGAFRTVMKKFKLNNELEAIQEILKGKATSKPEAHSGEGIFFTSKIADTFVLESFSHRLLIDNVQKDTVVAPMHRSLKGTNVIFSLSLRTKKHLSELFHSYQLNDDHMTFGKTMVLVKLYTLGTVYVSRSQARRLVSRLEQFQHVTLDFDNVPTIGQAFADEIFRVFKKSHPQIILVPINMNDTVKFMIDRVEK